MPAKKPAKVLVFGTFDMLHPGHIFFLKEAAKLGDLIVSVSSDEVVKTKKLKIPHQSETERKKAIEKLGIASKVGIGDRGIKTWTMLRKEKPDIIAVGYDQHKLAEALKKDQKKLGLDFKIQKIKSHGPDKYHTSLLHPIKKMSDADLISNQTLTDLLAKSKLKKALKQREADEKTKEHRLALLAEITGIEVNLPIYYTVEAFLNVKSDAKKWCFRLTINGTVEKHYGISHKQFQAILKKKNITKGDIRVTAFRGEITFSMILVVGKDSLIGECIADRLYCLTYDLPSTKIKFIFQLIGGTLSSINDKKIASKVQKILKSLRIKAGADIENNNKIPVGYYEYIESKTAHAVTDWNVSSISNNIYADRNNKKLSGIIVSLTDIENGKKPHNRILLAERLTNEILPIAQLSKGVILEQCSLLSHVAIVLRELKIPLIVDRSALEKYKSGQFVTLETT